MSESHPLLPATTRNILRGSGWTVCFFSTSITLGYLMFAAIGIAGSACASWDTSIAFFILMIGFPLALVISAVASTLMGAPLSVLFGYLLRRATSPAVHAIGAGIAGALTGTAVALLFGSLLHGVLAILIVASGLSAAGGWLMARRGQIRDVNEQRLRATLDAPY